MPEKMQSNWDEIVKEHADFECALFDGDEARAFISENYNSDVVLAFDTLKPYSYKSDLFRFCYLCINGGIYIDIKYKLVDQFRFSELIDAEYLTHEPLGVQTCLMVLLEKSQLMSECIDEIVQFALEKKRAKTPLFTGPALLSKMHLKLCKNRPMNADLVWSVENNLQIIRKNGNVILQQYDEYRKDLTVIDNPQPHYTKMFWNNEEYNNT
jgi:mannosyltransferase OCH1-like enzyme